MEFKVTILYLVLQAASVVLISFLFNEISGERFKGRKVSGRYWCNNTNNKLLSIAGGWWAKALGHGNRSPHSTIPRRTFASLEIRSKVTELFKILIEISLNVCFLVLFMPILSFWTLCDW